MYNFRVMQNYGYSGKKTRASHHEAQMSTRILKHERAIQTKSTLRVQFRAEGSCMMQPAYVLSPLDS